MGDANNNFGRTVTVPVRVPRRTFAERSTSCAFRVFLRLKPGAGGRNVLASSFHQEATYAVMAGDRLRAAKFYGASARVLVKLKAFEMAADRFLKQGKQLREEATHVNPRRGSSAFNFDLDLWNALELFDKAAQAFANAADNLRDGANCREARSSAGECYASAASIASAARDAGYDDANHLLVSKARSLYSLAVSAYKAAGDNAKAEELARVRLSERP